jgi:selenide,water dikinase
VDSLPFATQELMFDPQTSGGLLICVDPEQSRQLLAAIQKDDPQARIIGRIVKRQNEIILFGGN